MDGNRNKNTPTSPSQRIVAIDALRGFAVLGILIMNIQMFAMINQAYMNPRAFGSLEGIHGWVWALSHVLADQKFMTIFSILYGAGIYLVTRKIESEGRKSAGIYYRRTLWLLIFGLIHAYLLWHGDILVTYAVCALVIFLFRRVSPRWLLILGFLSILVPSLLFSFFGWSMPYWPPEAREDMLEDWQPNPEIVERELSIYQGGWMEQMKGRVPESIKFQTFVFLIWTGWRVSGLMLAGIALLKLGVLTAERSRRFYGTMLLTGFGLGLPLVIYGITRNVQAGWAVDYSMFFGSRFNYWGSILIALGYIGGVLLICKSGYLKRLTARFAAVGRMAFSNYILQTLICTMIFYGHGLGYFGWIERGGQILIVFGVWAFILIISPIWLRYFRFGPLEWAWRSLTYRRLQPIRP